jgi:hypothetical protein
MLHWRLFRLPVGPYFYGKARAIRFAGRGVRRIAIRLWCFMAWPGYQKTYETFEFTRRNLQKTHTRAAGTCVVGVAFLVWAVVCTAATASDPWTDHGEFLKAISAADAIVVRDGGFDCCQSVDGQKTLFRVTDPHEIKEIAAHIKFQSLQATEGCMCCGYPGIDWYKDGQRIALTSLQHGVALRWKGYPGDAQFTQESAAWIVTWLAKHAVAGPQKELDADKLRKAVNQEARRLLHQSAPVAYLKAIKRAEAEAEVAEMDKEATGFERMDQRDELKGRLRDKYIRAAFQDKKTMYVSLFRIMGCLPMRWNARYVPEQDEAYEFLVRAPREELDQAIRSAARSEDATERQGATRLVFSQHSMTDYDKSDHDIAQWMVMLAEAAYADPFPANRRLVLHRLALDYETPASAVFERAVADPDRTVRRKAVEAIQVHGGKDAMRILRKVAAGEIRPRAAMTLPTDYAKGAERSISTEGMDELAGSDTDQEAAGAAIRKIERERAVPTGR